MTDGDPNAGPRAFETIVYGGLAVGFLDFLDASTFFPLYYGIAFMRVWQGVAAGLLGRETAVAGGRPTAALGIFLHFVVALGIATAYFLLSRYLVTVKRPIAFGLLFGIVANLVMQNVVVPLSAIGPRTAVEPLGSILNSFVGHALLVGLPVALIAGWSGHKNRVR